MSWVKYTDYRAERNQAIKDGCIEFFKSIICHFAHREHWRFRVKPDTYYALNTKKWQCTKCKKTWNTWDQPYSMY